MTRAISIIQKCGRVGFAHMTVGMIAATLTSETPVVHVVQPRLLAPPTTNSWTPTPAGSSAGDFSV